MAKPEVREASELGLKPGDWPVMMTIEGRIVWKGKSLTAAGQFVGVHYESIDGDVAFDVLND